MKTPTSTQTNILNAAAAVLSKSPNASLNDIAEKAGVGRATLHRYYPKREELIRALVLQALEQTNEVVAPLYNQNLSKFETLKEIIRVLVPLGERFHFLTNETSINQEEEIKAIYQRQLDNLTTLVNAAKADGDILPDVPTAWLVAAIDMLIYTAWTTIEEGYVARRDAADLVIRTLFQGLAKRKDA